MNSYLGKSLVVVAFLVSGFAPASEAQFMRYMHTFAPPASPEEGYAQEAAKTDADNSANPEPEPDSECGKTFIRGVLASVDAESYEIRVPTIGSSNVLVRIKGPRDHPSKLFESFSASQAKRRLPWIVAKFFCLNPAMDVRQEHMIRGDVEDLFPDQEGKAVLKITDPDQAEPKIDDIVVEVVPEDLIGWAKRFNGKHIGIWFEIQTTKGT